MLELGCAVRNNWISVVIFGQQLSLQHLVLIDFKILSS